MVARTSLALALVAAIGCSESSLQYGQSLYSSPSVSTASSNPFSCALCHKTTADDTPPFIGHTLYDAANRPTYWGGFETTLLDALNQCVTNFMRGKALDATDEKARALHVYLDSLAPDPSPSPVPLTIVQNIKDVPSGDPTEGKQIWDHICANCHGQPHTGAGRIETSASLVPDDSIASWGTDPKTGARPVTIEKVRHGKFFSIGGNMPPFSLEALSDEQLGAVLGYLETFGLPKSPSP